jgi:hypothetical protein
MRMSHGMTAAMMVAAGVFAVAQSPGNGDLKTGPEAYKVTYTLTEVAAGKRTGVQHYALSVTGDQRTAEVKLGSRIPVNVGSAPSSDIQYIDIGLDIEASLREFSNGLELYSRVEQSRVAGPTSPVAHQPVIRSSSLRNTTLLTPGKSIMLGSLDEPGSTDHLDVEVLLEPIQ